MSRIYTDEGLKLTQKVMLATTAYDSPHASYTQSIQAGRLALERAGTPTAYLLLSGNCHVDDARNAVVREFLDSDCTDLVFIDADVSFEPDALIALCGFDVDLCGGIYPYRSHDREGMPVRMMSHAVEQRVDGLIEVEGLPTGFMRIRREVLEKLAGPAKKFVTRDHRKIPLLFERAFTGQGRLSGDLHFCDTWRRLGGKTWAAPELRLGHVATSVEVDSLGAFLRRRDGATIEYVCDAVAAGIETQGHYEELKEFIDNKWSASIAVLSTCVAIARKCTGPIIEAGSGISTILMAAANPNVMVHCLEHDVIFAEWTRRYARQSNLGFRNICLITAPISGVGEWYDLDDEDKEATKGKFSLGVVDGPPRQYQSRLKFFDVFGKRCQMIIVDDIDDVSYYAAVKVWCAENNRELEIISQRCGLIHRPKKKGRSK